MRFSLSCILAISVLLLSACSASSNSSAQKTPAERARQAELEARTSPAPSTAPVSQSSTRLDMLETAKALIRSASNGRVEAISTFPGPDGLIGVVTSEGPLKQKAVVWMTAAGNTVLPIGVNAKGESLNDMALAEQGIHGAPDEGLSKVTEPGNFSIMMGTKGPVMTVFMDPNCGYCKKIFSDFKDLVEAGKLRMRFVMVGFLREDSAAKSAFILASKNPLETLTRLETDPGFTPNLEKKLDEKWTDAVTQNGLILGGLGPVSTPTLLYCSDGRVVVSRGSPPNPESFIADLDDKAHPACAN